MKTNKSNAAARPLTYYENAAIAAFSGCACCVEQALQELSILAILMSAHGAGIENVLACGSARFQVSALPDLLRFWAAKANPWAEDSPLPKMLSQDSILAWAKYELSAAYAAEGENRPNAEVAGAVQGHLSLTWDGSWTKGRFISLGVNFDPEGKIEEGITLKWNSATGRPSRFLSIERLLGLEGVISFVAQASKEIEEEEEV